MATLNPVQNFLNNRWANGSMTPQAAQLTTLLNSELNKQPMLQDFEGLKDSNGKIYEVKAEYYPRFCATDLASTPGLDCSQSALADPSVATYTPDFDHGTYGFKYDPLSYDTKTDGGQDWFNMQVMRGLDKIRRDVERYTTIQLQSLAGKFSKASDGADATQTFKNVATKADTTGLTQNQFLMGNLKQDASANMFINMPTIVGFRSIGSYLRSMDYMGTDQYGLDAEKNIAVNGMNFIDTMWADEWTATSIERFISYDAGAVQLINIPQFRGDAVYEVGNITTMVITDPYTGLRIDLKKNITCDDAGAASVHVSMDCPVQLVGLPDDLYCTTDGAVDEADGVNGVLEYRVVEPS